MWKIGFIILVTEVLIFFSRVWSTEWKGQTLGSLVLATGTLRVTIGQRYRAWLLTLAPYYITAVGSLLFAALVIIHLDSPQEVTLNTFRYAFLALIPGPVVIIGFSQIIYLGALLAFLTLRLRTGGTISAMAIWVASFIAGFILATISPANGPFSTSFERTVFNIACLGIPQAIAAVFLFRSAHRLAELRASEG
jgi:uncharacterized membrane protein